MATGNGKIATLPREIREQLNWRINDDVPGIDIVKWLNSKPEVQEIMKVHYDGRPISEQNLSEWRKYGYQKWLALHTVLDEARELSEDASEFVETGVNCEKLLLALTASYAEMVQRWNIIPAEQLIYKMGVFKNLTNAVLTLRRAECTARKRSTAGRGALTAKKPELQIQAVRLQFERERLELLREKQRNKSASSSSTRASSSSESAPKSEPAHSTSGAQSGNTIPPVPLILPAHTPPTPSQSPATSSAAPAPNPATPTVTVPPNGCSSNSGAADLRSLVPASPAGAPSTSTPRNIRGLL